MCWMLAVRRLAVSPLDLIKYSRRSLDTQFFSSIFAPSHPLLIPFCPSWIELFQGIG